MSAKPIERISTQPAPLPNLGRYEALGQLASGGTGSVYLARLHGPGDFERLFAIKLLHAHLAAQPHLVQMLLEEAHLAAQIHHPHVVDMVEVGTTEDGRYFLVMGYIEGVSLDDLLAHPKLDAIRRVRLGLPILLDAMSGLDAVHRARDLTSGEPLGIVHRDVSPANILVGMDGIGRLADFGIAAARAHELVSHSEIVRGTPRYIAPEQARGAAPDPRSDVFGLGAVLWEVITGEQLFDSHVSVEDILQQVIGATIPPPSDRNSRMPEALDRVCLRALDRDMDQRYASVAELREALVQVAETEGLLAKPRELVTELGALFADHVSQRRELVRRRQSGPVPRPVVVAAGVHVAPDDPSFEDSVTIFRRSDAVPRKSLTQTQLGIVPPRESAPPDESYRLPRRSWRRWALLWATAFVLLAAYALGRGSEAPPRALPMRPVAPVKRAVVAEPVQVAVKASAAPERTAIEAAVIEAPLPAAEPAAEPVAERRAPAKRPAQRASSQALASRDSVALDDALPLETNPYRSQH